MLRFAVPPVHVYVNWELGTENSLHRVPCTVFRVRALHIKPYIQNISVANNVVLAFKGCQALFFELSL